MLPTLPARSYPRFDFSCRIRDLSPADAETKSSSKSSDRGKGLIPSCISHNPSLNLDACDSPHSRRRRHIESTALAKKEKKEKKELTTFAEAMPNCGIWIEDEHVWDPDEVDEGDLAGAD